jgi:hypothetical protein
MNTTATTIATMPPTGIPSLSGSSCLSSGTMLSALLPDPNPPDEGVVLDGGD